MSKGSRRPIGLPKDLSLCLLETSLKHQAASGIMIEKLPGFVPGCCDAKRYTQVVARYGKGEANMCRVNSRSLKSTRAAEPKG